jgi:DNA-binding transcriptional MerR regulator
MTWSTRELAELAGTTVNTIRHYHRLGLMEEPERRYNGYKQYGVQDLVCLLRIRRLVDLRVPLARIGRPGSATDIDPQVLREVDADLAVEAERLRKVRSDIAVILRDAAPADAPASSPTNNYASPTRRTTTAVDPVPRTRSSLRAQRIRPVRSPPREGGR